MKGKEGAFVLIGMTRFFVAMKEEKPKEKSRASMIIDGLIEPEENERYLLNLRKRVPFNQMPEDKRKEICRKGAEAINKLHGEKKTAKESLSKILTLKVTDEIIENADVDPAVAEKLKRDNPDATLYDLIQAVAVGRALEGNIKAAEYVRDTHGDKPIERVEVTENVTTDQDRELMRTIAARLEKAESVQIIDSTYTDSGTDSGV